MGYNFCCMIASDTRFVSRRWVFGVKLSGEDIAEIECKRVIVTMSWQPILGLNLLFTGSVWTIMTGQLVMKGV